MNKLPNHFMSFKTSKEDKTEWVVVTDSLDPNKRSTSKFQKTFNLDKPAGAHFPMTAYNAQPEAHNNNHHQQNFPAPNISLSINNPFFKTHFTGLASQNLGGATAKQPLVGAVSVSASQPTLPSAGSIAGFTEQWNTPAQLTIFYGGTVNVFDEISPEKAQAIMFFAGTGGSVASNPNSQRIQLQTQPENGGVTVSQNMNTAPNSSLSSPISVSSHTGSNNEMLQAHKPTGVSVTPFIRSIRPTLIDPLCQQL